MNYVQFHVGDWDSSTRLLSPLEKGVYIDLLMLYYSLERPLMRSECDRIARAYADEEKTALEYVLERFFKFDGESYVHERCDKEIANCREKSEKAAKSAKSRWSKMQTQSERNTNAVRTQCDSNANQEPITNNQYIKEIYKEKEVADAPGSSSFSSNDGLEDGKAEKQARARKFDVTTLPYEWFIDAVDICPDLDAYKLFESFSDYWTNVSGAKGKKIDWKRTWRNYLRDLPSWKRENYVREGGLVWDGKPWRRPVDPDSSLGRYYAMQEDAIKQSKAEDELLAYAETRLKNFGLINHDPF